jgi:hypothetical protein
MGFVADGANPVSVANELMRRKWEPTWPRRPKWLRQLIHGQHPPQV